MDVVFLDANVLFSAAYRSDSGLLRLWGLDNAELVTSRYAAEEAGRNLLSAERRRRLDELVGRLRTVSEAPMQIVPEHAVLPEKDRPILQAAIAAGASHLLTGDMTHFGPYFGRRLAGVLIQAPAEYLRDRLSGGR